MINEKVFIKRYTAFWKNIFPLSNLFMRNVNRETTEGKDDISIDTTGRRMSFVSHIGFLLFSLAIKKSINLEEIKKINLSDANYKDIENFAIEQFRIYDDDSSSINSPLDENELGDALLLAERLILKFTNQKDPNRYFLFDESIRDIISQSENLLRNYHAPQELIVSPFFKGCGFIDDCSGDLIYGDTLVEIKTVNRNFHIQDFRQLMTYCALNYASKQYNIRKIGIYNPRNSMWFTISLDDFAQAISGRDLPELCWDILNFISEDEASK